jgi:alpha-beta hydrolase superfamily lysophospholipase
MKNNFRKVLFLSSTLFVIWFCLSLFGSFYSTRTHHCNIPPAADFFDQNVKNVSIKTADDVEIKAWWVSNQDSSKAVILLNGIGANRMGMIERAKIYLNLGYNVLLPDLRGTGESGGQMISFGWQERLDLEACCHFLQKSGVEEIGVHGNSLGAATIAYSLPNHPTYSFVVMESVYDNIENALNNRLKSYHIPPLFCAAMTAITEIRIDAKMEELKPEDYVSLINVPVLILAGDSEQKVKKSETEKVFLKVGSSKKQLHFFKGAKHENFLSRYREEYTQLLKSWIAQL